MAAVNTLVLCDVLCSQRHVAARPARPAIRSNRRMVMSFTYIDRPLVGMPFIEIVSVDVAAGIPGLVAYLADSRLDYPLLTKGQPGQGWSPSVVWFLCC